MIVMPYSKLLRHIFLMFSKPHLPFIPLGNIYLKRPHTQILLTQKFDWKIFPKQEIICRNVFISLLVTEEPEYCIKKAFGLIKTLSTYENEDNLKEI